MTKLISFLSSFVYVLFFELEKLISSLHMTSYRTHFGYYSDRIYKTETEIKSIIGKSSCQFLSPMVAIWNEIHAGIGYPASLILLTRYFHIHKYQILLWPNRNSWLSSYALNCLSLKWAIRNIACWKTNWKKTLWRVLFSSAKNLSAVLIHCKNLKQA